MQKSICLSSVSSFKQINSSPLNRSSSKHLWSFSKDDRFKSSKVQYINKNSAVIKFIKFPAISAAKAKELAMAGNLISPKISLVPLAPPDTISQQSLIIIARQNRVSQSLSLAKYSFSHEENSIKRIYPFGALESPRPKQV